MPTSGAIRPKVDSVELALDQIGDRWTFLLLREAFFGVKRFDRFRANTGASPAVLTDRLKKLVANGLFSKTVYGSHANRYEYHLTNRGLDLYPMIVLLMQWGDKWLHEQAPPIELVHHCGQSGPFVLDCGSCRKPIEAKTTTWTNVGAGTD